MCEIGDTRMKETKIKKLKIEKVIGLCNGYDSNYCAYCKRKIGFLKRFFNLDFPAFTWDDNGFKFTFCKDECRDKMEKVIGYNLFYARGDIM